MRKRQKAGFVPLPKGVHAVRSRGRDYFYWHPGRGTVAAGKRVRIPHDPSEPAFWADVRRLQGIASGPREITFADVLTDYEASKKFNGLAPGTQDQYRIQIRTANALFGDKSPDALRPSLVREAVEAMTSGRGNSFLGVMRAISSWGIAHDKLTHKLTEGIEYNEKTGGHKPWTDAQVEAARKRLTGMVRRGVMLAIYTGQRGSDIVRLGWTDIDDGGFTIKQQKTGREVWCPIDPDLAAEMATWEKRPGPFLRHEAAREKGRAYTRKRLDIHFAEQRDKIPELSGVTLHGLRATAVIRLRRSGLTALQIRDIIGMSPAMIERYCRFADKKASGKAVVKKLADARRNG